MRFTFATLQQVRLDWAICCSYLTLVKANHALSDKAWLQALVASTFSLVAFARRGEFALLEAVRWTY